MAVGFGGIVAEVFHHIQTDVLVPGKLCPFHKFIKLIRALYAVCLDADIPCLVV